LNVDSVSHITLCPAERDVVVGELLPCVQKTIATNGCFLSVRNRAASGAATSSMTLYVFGLIAVPLAGIKQNPLTGGPKN
jgi:hypothetical protein